MVTNKKVFVSFDYDKDKNYKLLLQAWDANQNFDFSFSDQSITEPINSEDASRIKAGITSKMNNSTYCLVIVGEHTYKSEWVNWEIENASRLGLQIIAVKIDKSYETPLSLYNKNASWAMSFSQQAIVNAIREAENKNLKQYNQKNYDSSKAVSCKRCHRPLTNPRSIELGYGPSCRNKI